NTHAPLLLLTLSWYCGGDSDFGAFPPDKWAGRLRGHAFSRCSSFPFSSPRRQPEAAAAWQGRGGGKMAVVVAAAAWLWSGFWSERFWFPANVTWTDLERDGPDGESGYRSSHVLAAFPLAAGILVVRHLFERCIAKPCAVCLDIQDGGPCRAQPNAILEKVFTTITKCPDARRLEGLSKQLDWDVRKIQRWFRHRRNQDKPSTVMKFCESMWRLIFYLCIFSYGFRFLWSSPWFWDTRQCWYNYPFQSITPGLYYYYITQLAFYWALMFSQFTDIKRKQTATSIYRTLLLEVQCDCGCGMCTAYTVRARHVSRLFKTVQDFQIMLIHHFATIVLITFSYMNKMVRVGTLIMLLHDASDPLLEVAKMANYAKYQRLCDATFILFCVVFIVIRLGIFPVW
ncbi:Ceramide synthase 5, partial [Varanus komodoensis]